MIDFAILKRSSAVLTCHPPLQDSNGRDQSSHLPSHHSWSVHPFEDSGAIANVFVRLTEDDLPGG